MAVCFDEALDGEFCTIVLENGKEYTGLFSNLRVDRKTVPEGLYAYDLRHDDAGVGDICQVQYFVMVNHWGTIFTKDPIEGIENCPIVVDSWYNDVRDDSVAEFEKYLPEELKKILHNSRTVAS